MKRLLLIILMFLFSIPCFAENDLSRQAVAFYSDNNLNKTLDTLLQIEEQNRTPQDWLLLGNLMEEKGELNSAVYMYQKAISTDKKYYKSYYNLGNIYLNDEKYALAVENYNKGLKYNKTNPYLYYNLSCAYLKQGKIKKAKSNLIKALDLKNDIPEIHYNLAYVYKSLNNKKLAEVYLNNYNKLISDN